MLDEIDGGLAPSSVHRHYRTMRRMFQVAVEKENIPANPCERVHPPKVPKTQRVTAEILGSHLERCAGPGRDGLVFPNTAGNPLAESSFYVHRFKNAQVSCGFKLRFHDLRHQSVALAIAGGAHPKAI